MSPPILEPQKWLFDGDLTRREPVIDPNDGRVIRRVGYRKCLACPKHFWSEDVIGVRLCDYCKTVRAFD